MAKKVVEMVRPIVLEKEDGTKLTLEYDRGTIFEMDRAGVIGGTFLATIDEHPISSMFTIFRWSLVMHHKEITDEQAKEIFFEIGLDSDFMTRLTELFLASYTSIIDARKNSVWTVK